MYDTPYWEIPHSTTREIIAGIRECSNELKRSPWMLADHLTFYGVSSEMLQAEVNGQFVDSLCVLLDAWGMVGCCSYLIEWIQKFRSEGHDILLDVAVFFWFEGDMPLDLFEDASFDDVPEDLDL